MWRFVAGDRKRDRPYKYAILKAVEASPQQKTLTDFPYGELLPEAKDQG